MIVSWKVAISGGKKVSSLEKRVPFYVFFTDRMLAKKATFEMKVEFLVFK